MTGQGRGRSRTKKMTGRRAELRTGPDRIGQDQAGQDRGQDSTVEGHDRALNSTGLMIGHITGQRTEKKREHDTTEGRTEDIPSGTVA